MKSDLRYVALTVTMLFGCAGAAPEDSSGDAAEALSRAQCRGARNEADARCRLEGVVERAVAAEFDPFVVGDACVTFVRVGTTRYGLVTDFDACGDTERYATADVRVSFSKGAISLISGARRRVLTDYDANATYYDFSGELRETTALAAFDALGRDEKVAALYANADSDWPSLRAGFSQRSIRIVDTFTGSVLRDALAAYREESSHSFESGGDKPDVFAIVKDGDVYAYGIASSGRSYGNWATLAVYDRSFAEIGRFGISD